MSPARPPHRARQVSLAALMWIVACDRSGSSTAPTRAGPSVRAAGLGIPYPVSEPERIEGWSRAALSRSSFAAVFWHTEPGAFARGVAGPGPVVVGAHIKRSDVEGQPFAALLEEAFGGRPPPRPTTTKVAARALAALGFPRPTPSLFVVGTDQNCRAELGDAVVSYYVADEPVLQIDWALRGCDADGDWAPIAVVSNRLPEDTVWVPAQTGLDTRLDATPGWQGPLAAALPRPDWSAPQAPQLEIVRVLKIPDVRPTVVQVYDSLVRVGDDNEHARLSALGLDPACADRHATTITYGAWNGTLFDGFEPARAADKSPHLLGAFVRGDQIDALVYDHALDPLVVIPPAPTLEGESDWVRKPLTAAIHTEYARQSWGYLPTSDPSPRGAPCKPRPS